MDNYDFSFVKFTKFADGTPLVDGSTFTYELISSDVIRIYCQQLYQQICFDVQYDTQNCTYTVIDISRPRSSKQYNRCDEVIGFILVQCATSISPGLDHVKTLYSFAHNHYQNVTAFYPLEYSHDNGTIIWNCTTASLPDLSIQVSLFEYDMSFVFNGHEYLWYNDVNKICEDILELIHKYTITAVECISDTQDESIHNIADYYGLFPQIDITIEEMAELTKELIKFKRNPKLPSEVYPSTIAEECADVQIML